MRRLTSFALAAALSVVGCAHRSEPFDTAREYGTSPNLQSPQQRLIPTVNPRRAVGWQAGESPTPMAGLTVTAFAKGLAHPRWLLCLPNGDLLVAESNRPAGSGGFSGIKGWIAGWIFDYAGAGAASADRLTLLRDSDGDGVADARHTFLEGLHSPFGMVLVDDTLFIANADALVAVPYEDGDTVATRAPVHIADLPAGRNHHWTKNVIQGPKPGQLLVAVGSNSNIGENGLAVEKNRAAILQVDRASGQVGRFATGLRNPVGMAWEPTSRRLWTVVNERDELGDQLVPDYLTAVAEGDDFGWPHTYWGGVRDPRVDTSGDVAREPSTPDYALGAHTASLGLAFTNQRTIPALQSAALIGQHGSWNRSQPSGYKVVAVRFEAGIPTGLPFDVLTGFLNEHGQARGRPAGVSIDARGAIYVADDVGNTVWRLAPPSGAAQN